MIFVIIELSPRMRFNPFTAQPIDLLGLYEASKNSAKESRTPLVFYKSRDEMQDRIERLTAQFTRFLVLEMLLDNHFLIPSRPTPFVESITRADFNFRTFQRPMPRMQRAEAKRDNTQVTTNTSPFAHIPKPDAAKQNKAGQVATKLGDKLPQECYDPISAEPLRDPVEINKRVYNRETAAHLLKDGKFEDPFSRVLVDPATAQPAHYMLDAIAAHEEVMTGKEPAMLSANKNSDVYPLRDLIEVWEKLLHDFRPGPGTM